MQEEEAFAVKFWIFFTVGLVIVLSLFKGFFSNDEPSISPPNEGKRNPRRKATQNLEDKGNFERKEPQNRRRKDTQNVGSKIKSEKSKCD